MLLRVDTLVVFANFGAEAAGVYSVAVSTAGLVGLAPTQFAHLVLYRGAQGRSVQVSRDVLGSICIAGLASLPLIIVGDLLIPAVYGAAFESSYGVMLCALPAAIAFGVIQIYTNQYRMTNRPLASFLCSAAGVGVMGAGLFLLGNPHGLKGVAVSVSLGCSATALLLHLFRPGRSSRPHGPTAAVD
jgi:O-antigen/teichoic acid export membrane protein